MLVGNKYSSWQNTPSHANDWASNRRKSSACCRCRPNPSSPLDQPDPDNHPGNPTETRRPACEPAAPVLPHVWTTGRKEGECECVAPAPLCKYIHAHFRSKKRLTERRGRTRTHLTDVTVVWSTAFKEFHPIVLSKLQETRQQESQGQDYCPAFYTLCLQLPGKESISLWK